MAKGINKVILVGNLGQDPDLRHTQSGTAVCNMRLATNESYKDKNGEWVDKTEWHSLVAWSRLAEICDEYLQKGSQIYAEGSLQTRQWEDKNGNTRYTTEVKLREVMFLSDGGSNGGQRSQQRQSSTRGAPQRQQRPQRQQQSFDDAFEPDDELPF